MTWSARELGELAGTSRRTVRHYQELGLLHEPRRTSNGYQHYDVTHLVRLLRIRRLAELGLPLSQVRDLSENDAHPKQALESLRAGIDDDIERLQRLRADVDAILAGSAPLDLPVEFAVSVRGISQADHYLTVALSKILSSAAVGAWEQILSPYGNAPAVIAFDSLQPNASEDRRVQVTEDLTVHMREIEKRNPSAIHLIREDLVHRPDSRRRVDDVLADLYNEAQLDVVRRTAARLA